MVIKSKASLHNTFISFFNDWKFFFFCDSNFVVCWLELNVINRKIEGIFFVNLIFISIQEKEFTS